MRGRDSLPVNNQFFPRTSSCQKAKDQIAGGWTCILLTLLKSSCCSLRWVNQHAKGITGGQSQLPATAGLCLLGSGGMARGICCIPGWGSEPALTLLQHTWCLVSLSTGVSMHHAWKISCAGIHYPEGGMAEGLTLLSPHLPRSCPFHLGFCCVVFSPVRMQQVLPDGSRGCSFNWGQFYVAVRSVKSPGFFLWSEGRGSLLVIN